MVVLSRAEEDVLQAILEHYTTNEDNYIKTTYEIFPKYVLSNITRLLDGLKYKSLIANYDSTFEDVGIYLTPDGVNYSENKKKQIFPKSSMELLRQLLEQDNPVEYMQYLFDGLDSKSDHCLRAMMRDLKEKGYIFTSWADDIPDHIEFNEKAYTSEEDSQMEKGMYIINNNITNGNANINSTDNSVRNTSITYNENVADMFERMLKVASGISEGNKDDIIMAIDGMKDNYNKPSLKEKYYKFIEVAANHMALFSPFIPALTEMVKQCPM